MFLSPSQILKEGDDLWIISDGKNSHWYGKIDWLCNFQLSHSEIHKSKPLSSWLTNYMQTSQLNFPEPPDDKNNLLIPVDSVLPTQWVCVIPFQGSIQNWIENVHSVWSQWQKPTLRVFIPKTIQTGEWKSYWKTLEPKVSPTLVIDSKT